MFLIYKSYLPVKFLEKLNFKDLGIDKGEIYDLHVL